MKRTTTLENKASDIGLRLFYNSLTSESGVQHSLVENRVFTNSQLYQDNSALEFSLNDTVIAKIFYVNDLLTVISDYKVDIELCGNILANSLLIKTLGGVSLANATSVNLKDKVLIVSPAIVIDIPKINSNIVNLEATQSSDGTITLNSPIVTKKLQVKSHDFTVNHNISATNTNICAVKTYISEDAKISTPNIESQMLNTSKKFDDSKKNDNNTAPASSVEKSTATDSTIQPENKIKFYIESEDIICKGDLNLNAAVLKCTTLSLTGMFITLNDTQIFTKKLRVGLNSNIAGTSVYIKSENNVSIDGRFKINELRVDADELNITGLLWGVDSLELHIENCINNTGVLGSNNNTSIYGKPYILTTALRANQAVKEGIFLNGAIVGRNMLYIDGLATIVFAGGCLYGKIIKQKNGLYANILGMRVTYTRLNYSLVSFSKFSLNVPFTLDAFSMTNNFKAFCDLLSGDSEISMYDASLLLSNIFPFASLLPIAMNFIEFLNNATAEDCLKYCKEIGNNFLAELKATVNLINELRKGNMTSNHIKHMVDNLLSVGGFIIQTKNIIANGLHVIESLQHEVPQYISMFESIDFEKVLQYPSYIYSDFLIDKAKTFAQNSVALIAPNSVDASLLNLSFDVNIDGTTRQISLINLSNGASFALSSSVEALVIHNSLRSVYAYKHSEEALFRDSSSKIFANSLSITADTNIERGLNQTLSLLIRARNMVVAKNSNITAQDTTIVVETELNSDGILTLGKGSLIVKGQVVYSVNSNTNARNLDMVYHRDVKREGQENFDECLISVSGNNTTAESLTATHTNTNEYINGTSNDSGNVQKVGGRKIVGKSQQYGEKSTFIADNAELVYQDDLQRSGKQQLNNSSVYVGNNETNTSNAVTEYSQTQSVVIGDYVEFGTLKMQNSSKKVGESITLTSGSKPTLKDVSFDGGNGFTSQANQGEFENVLLLDKKSIELDHTSNTDASNLQLIAPNVSIDGEVQYSNDFHIEANHVSSSEDSKIECKPLENSTFSIIADTIDMKGQETHVNDFEIINNISASAARDLALSERKTIENSISVTCEDDSTYEYLGGRKDNAHVSINTNGLVALPANKYDRAKGKTFASYEDAVAFVRYSYNTYNLPPEPKKKRTVWRKIGDEVTKGTAKVLADFGGYVAITLSCLPGGQLAGAAVGAAAVGANIALDKREKRKIEQQAARELKAAYEQKLTQQSTLSDEEKAILEMLTREEHFAKIQDARNRMLDSNSDGELQQIESIFKETRLNVAQEFSLLQQNVSDAHQEKASHILYKKQYSIDTINARKHSLGVGASSNIGGTGYDVKVTITNYTKEGRSLTSGIEVYNKNTHRTPSIPIPESRPTNSETSQESHAPLDFPETQMPDVPILNSPEATINSQTNLHSDPTWQQERINQTMNNGLFSEPLFFGNDTDSTNDHNVNYTPAPAPEKSKLRKFLELFEGDEDFHVDFHDVKITPELRAGRAFVTRSIVRNTKESIVAIYNIHTYLELSTMAWDGINEISHEVFGVASQASLERNQQRLQNLEAAWQAFKAADGETKSYILLDLTIGITTGMLTAKGAAGVDKYVNKMLAHHALPPLLKQIKKDLEKAQKASNALKKPKQARQSANKAASLPVLSTISSEATYIQPLRELAEAAGKPVMPAAALSSTPAKVVTGAATGNAIKATTTTSSMPARTTLTGASATGSAIKSTATTSSIPTRTTTLTEANATATAFSTISSNRLLPSMLEQSASTLFKQPIMFSQGQLASHLNQSLPNRTMASIKDPVDNLAGSAITLPVPKPIKNPFANLKPPPPEQYKFFENNLTNPIFREKIGLTNPLIRPHESWGGIDYLSEFDYLNPTPLTLYELEIVNQWMFERKQLLDILNRIDLDIISDYTTRKLFSKIKTQLDEHMKPGDICALIKEQRGIKIYKDNGKPHQHIREWTGAKKSLRNAIEDFEIKGKYDAIHNELLSRILSKASKLWQRYDELLYRATLTNETQPKSKPCQKTLKI